MVDWPGLLKWSLANTDGTQTKADIKPMDNETKKWLEEALESYSLDEAKRMRDIIQELTKPETKDDSKEEERKVVLLDEIAELVEGLENARDLVRMGIFEPIVYLMFNSVHPEVRKNAYYVFASCNSNNTLVQESSVQMGALNLVNSVTQETTTVNKEAAFAALSSLVRGECLGIKRTFIDIEGIEFLLEVLSNDKVCSSNKIRIKAMTLLYDMTFYDDKLDYVDMATYNNPTGSQEKKVNDKSSKLVPLKKEDKKEEEKTGEEKKAVGPSGEIRDLSGYKNIVKKKLIQKGFLDLYSIYLTKENLKALMDLRTAYFGVAICLMQFDPSCVPSKEYFNKISEFAEHLKEENKKHEDLFQPELDVLKQVEALQK